MIGPNALTQILGRVRRQTLSVQRFKNLLAQGRYRLGQLASPSALALVSLGFHRSSNALVRRLGYHALRNTSKQLLSDADFQPEFPPPTFQSHSWTTNDFLLARVCFHLHQTRELEQQLAHLSVVDQARLIPPLVRQISIELAQRASDNDSNLQNRLQWQWWAVLRHLPNTLPLAVTLEFLHEGIRLLHDQKASPLQLLGYLNQYILPALNSHELTPGQAKKISARLLELLRVLTRSTCVVPENRHYCISISNLLCAKHGQLDTSLSLMFSKRLLQYIEAQCQDIDELSTFLCTIATQETLQNPLPQPGLFSRTSNEFSHEHIYTLGTIARQVKDLNKRKLFECIYDLLRTTQHHQTARQNFTFARQAMIACRHQPTHWKKILIDIVEQVTNNCTQAKPVGDQAGRQLISAFANAAQATATLLQNSANDQKSHQKVNQLHARALYLHRADKLLEVAEPFLDSAMYSQYVARFVKTIKSQEPAPETNIDELIEQIRIALPSATSSADVGVFNDKARQAYSEMVQCFTRRIFTNHHESASPGPLMLPEFLVDFQNNLSARLREWKNSGFYQDFVQSDKQRFQLRQQSAAHTSGTSPRILLVSGMWGFAAPMVKPLQDQGLEIRTFDFNVYAQAKESAFSMADNFVPSKNLPAWTEYYNDIKHQTPMFAELLEWSDVVLIDWCGHEALWLIRALPPHKKVVVRLHSFEAFRNICYVANWGGIDGLIFVSEPVRQFVNAQHGERLTHLKQTTIANINRCKPADNIPTNIQRSFTLGLAGFNNANKNPVLALEILKSLRQHDDRWNLRLVGHPWKKPEELVDQTERDHYHAFADLLQDPVIADGVIIDDFTNDIAQWFEKVGFILSCSDREGTHETIIEGMAAGSVPVVRRWPLLSAFGGPDRVYPDLENHLFESADQACAIIMEKQRQFDQACQQSVQRFQSTFAPDVVAKQYRAFLTSI